MTPRLYINAPLETGAAVALSAGQAHYLKNVLRREQGDQVRLFNGRDGEFAAEILELKKKGGLVAAKEQTREQNKPSGLVLAFAPVKRSPLEMIMQKATEIGVEAFAPVITERTVAPKINLERLQAIVIEASEQCDRLTVPTIDKPVKLGAWLDDWPTERHIFFCDEAGDDEDTEWGGPKGRAAPALDVLKGFDRNADGTAMLIGPEGGFSAGERSLLRAKEFVTPITLGPRILRADTAAISALVLWQAALGDWKKT